MNQSRYCVFDDLLEGLQVIDENWRYYYVNKTVANQAKSSVDALVGRTMMEMFPGIDGTPMFEILKQCMHSGEAATFINEFDFPDGSKGFFELRMQKVPEGVLIMSLDVSEQKNLELKLRQGNDNLEYLVHIRTLELSSLLDREKQLNELKAYFISLATHEFKNHLGVVQIGLHMLDGFNLPPHVEDREKFHRQMKVSVKQMFDLIKEFLSIDNEESGKLNSMREDINILELMRLEIDKLRSAYKNGQKINYLHEGNSEICINPQILRSITYNLLSNAIKYSVSDVKMNTVVRPDRLQLTISDQGIGIPKKDHKHLFEQFFRADNTEGINGTGLGLHLVKRYVEILGGEVLMESEEGSGTVVNVDIPLTV